MRHSYTRGKHRIDREARGLNLRDSELRMGCDRNGKKHETENTSSHNPWKLVDIKNLQEGPMSSDRIIGEAHTSSLPTHSFGKEKKNPGNSGVFS